MAEVVRAHTSLAPADIARLETLVEEWGLLADAAFADLILWVPDDDPEIFWAVAQVRPGTGPTALKDDVVGDESAYEPDSPVSEAYWSRAVATTSGSKLYAGIPVEQLAVPLVVDDEVLAVVELHQNRLSVRAPGALEEAYLFVAHCLLTMLATGAFPRGDEPRVPFMSPRIGDGSLLVDAQGIITFASPNGISAFRRLGASGDVVGERFDSLLATLPLEGRVPLDRALSGASLGAFEQDLESDAAAVRLRVQPLADEHGPAGALVMCRDHTELRQRERQLVTRNATIREMHHRVKNNLQTMSALLRLQARRAQSDETKDALGDARRRLEAIATAHEIMSRSFDTSVDCDDLLDRLMARLHSTEELRGVRIERTGSIGSLPAAMATNLAITVGELVANAGEHGLGAALGVVSLDARRSRDALEVRVSNAGTPLPPDFALDYSTGLGLSIVATLVSDVDGRFDLASEGERTVATITIPLA